MKEWVVWKFKLKEVKKNMKIVGSHQLQNFEDTLKGRYETINGIMYPCQVLLREKGWESLKNVQLSHEKKVSLLLLYPPYKWLHENQ